MSQSLPLDPTVGDNNHTCNQELLDNALASTTASGVTGFGCGSVEYEARIKCGSKQHGLWDLSRLLEGKCHWQKEEEEQQDCNNDYGFHCLPVMIFPPTWLISLWLQLQKRYRTLFQYVRFKNGCLLISRTRLRGAR